MARPGPGQPDPPAPSEPASQRPKRSYGDGRTGSFPRLLSANEVAQVSRTCGLTPREAEVLTALTRGLSDADIAAELGVSLETARKHRQAVLRKCGCTSRLQLVLWLVHRCLLGAAPAGAPPDSAPERNEPTPYGPTP
ncbi:MAG: LuxR family transcriptional regulator [Phycisphaerales bacterium]|nr:MAG: LuxR family transcriptional regulator [Phycisphaerales bacterium]